jgi:hypothetical protein
MNFFNSRNFLNFVKNKKSIRLINQTKINKIKTICSNVIENRTLIKLKNVSNINKSMLLQTPFSLNMDLLTSESFETIELTDSSGKI